MNTVEMTAEQVAEAVPAYAKTFGLAGQNEGVNLELVAATAPDRLAETLMGFALGYHYDEDVDYSLDGLTILKGLKLAGVKTAAKMLDELEEA